MILVVGATGELGGRVAKLLAADGETVRVLSRAHSDPDKITELGSIGIETVRGDLQDPASLAEACRDVEAVVSTATAITRPDTEGTLTSVDQDGNLALIEAAEAAGVQRFVFVSFLRPDGLELDFPLWLAKRAVEDRLRSSTLEYTIIHGNAFMETWLAPITGFDYVNGTARFVDSDGKINFVSIDDVARVTASAVRHPAARNKTIAVGGPEAATYAEAVRLFEEASGRSFDVVKVPPEVLRASYAQENDAKVGSFVALTLSMGYDWSSGPDEATELLGLSGHRWTGIEAYARTVCRALPT